MLHRKKKKNRGAFFSPRMKKHEKKCVTPRRGENIAVDFHQKRKISSQISQIRDERKKLLATAKSSLLIKLILKVSGIS